MSREVAPRENRVVAMLSAVNPQGEGLVLTALIRLEAEFPNKSRPKIGFRDRALQ